MPTLSGAQNAWRDEGGLAGALLGGIRIVMPNPAQEPTCPSAVQTCPGAQRIWPTSVRPAIMEMDVPRDSPRLVSGSSRILGKDGRQADGFGPALFVRDFAQEAARQERDECAKRAEHCIRDVGRATGREALANFQGCCQ
jgi:hypothetical protein